MGEIRRWIGQAGKKEKREIRKGNRREDKRIREAEEDKKQEKIKKEEE